jgi:uncharacterized protein
MIARLMEEELRAQLSEFPIVTVLGPRQAGKTTLARTSLPDFEYVSLEDPETLAIAKEDPRGFLNGHPGRVIFDEIQRAPHLLSYLQGIVDEEGANGQFVLTGSHQLELRQAVSQSLAGRTGMLLLLPLSIPELAAADMALESFEQYLHHGFLPRVHANSQRPRVAYANYYQTYVERDVRQLIQLKDASLFEKFIKLLAGRVGQLVNHSSLAGDVGIDAKTVRHWLSILEASFIIFKHPPYFENFGKRVIKSPKYYFTDTGLLTYLLGIEQPSQITRDPLVGSLFENLVVLEALKSLHNQGRTPNLYFFRDSHGNEIDLLHDAGRRLTGVEIKSSATYHSSFKKNLLRFAKQVAPLARSTIVYNGERHSFSDGIEALPFDGTHELFDRGSTPEGP